MILKKYTLSIFYAFCFSYLISSLSFAQEAKIPNRGSSYVNDFAGLITSTDFAKITKYCSELERKTSSQVAVVTVKSTKPETIHSYSVRLFYN